MNKKQLINLPPINKYSSRKEWEDACWHKIIKSEELLELLATSYERHNSVMRAAVLKELALGRGPRQISRDLFVSSQTINVARKAMTESSYKSYLERSKKERKKKVYSDWEKPLKPKYRGRPKRTKYGTIYMPY